MTIKRAYKTLYKSGLTLEKARETILGQTTACRELGLLTDFLENSTRGIIR